MKEEFRPPKEVVMEIMQEYLSENEYDLSMHNELGRTFENFIKQQKTDSAYDAIEFTLAYLKETKPND